MIAFEISLNGERIYTCGAGDLGHLSFSLHSLGILTANGPSHEHTRAHGAAVDPWRAMKIWPGIDDLKAGDEIRVRIIEVDACDPPEKEYSRPGKPFYATKNLRQGKLKDNLPKPKDDEAFRLFPDEPDSQGDESRSP